MLLSGSAMIYEQCRKPVPLCPYNFRRCRSSNICRRSSAQQFEHDARIEAFSTWVIPSTCQVGDRDRRSINGAEMLPRKGSVPVEELSSPTPFPSLLYIPNKTQYPPNG
ncbi:hypothetical protein V6N12_051355 [Hibiscus sabdariffa]|uniref:Uncharacterized protein n=1 Tax=Hibiscus sabdariffa TaxID=183260 RepID=A0ABR2GFD4_9ROSI